MSEDIASDRCLICTLGTGEYRPVLYHLGERRAGRETRFSPIAVGEIVAGEAPLRVVPFLTAAASETYGKDFEAEVRSHPAWRYEPQPIPDGKSEQELWEIFEQVGSVLRPGEDVILDCTHAFRSLPIALVAALQYYRIQKPLRTLSVYYGNYEAREGNEVPIFDLTPMIALADWTFALQVFEDYQISAPLGQQLEQLQIRAHTGEGAGASPPTRLQSVGQKLQRLDGPLRYGLPIEAGSGAAEALAKAEQAAHELEAVPPFTQPWEQLRAQLREIALAEPLRGDAKRHLRLSKEELRRQANLIRAYLSGGNALTAVPVIREWIVSAWMLEVGKGSQWLAAGTRDQVARTIGQDRRCEDESYTASQRALCLAWSAVHDSRNAFAHAGFRVESVDATSVRENIREVFEQLWSGLGREGFWEGPGEAGEVSDGAHDHPSEGRDAAVHGRGRHTSCAGAEARLLQGAAQVLVEGAPSRPAATRAARPRERSVRRRGQGSGAVELRAPGIEGQAGVEVVR